MWFCEGAPKKDPSATKIDPSKIKKPVYLFLGSTDRLPTVFETVNLLKLLKKDGGGAGS
jgi:hypothetical protein